MPEFAHPQQAQQISIEFKWILHIPCMFISYFGWCLSFLTHPAKL